MMFFCLCDKSDKVTYKAATLKIYLMFINKYLSVFKDNLCRVFQSIKMLPGHTESAAVESKGE